MTDSTDLTWDKARLAPTHSGPHDPVSLGDDVVCGICGAEARNGDSEEWPPADNDLREVLNDE